MRISKSVLAATTALAAISIALTGCTATATPDPMASHDMGSMTQGDSKNDAVMFAQMMIPHHLQALTMSAYAKNNTTNTDVLKLAEQIYTGQAGEIETMKSWLGSTAVEGHAMTQGMLSDEEMKTLSAAKGADFDKLFLTGMKAHHEGALAMATQFQRTSDVTLKKMVTTILQTQTVEVAIIKQLLKD
jgi:uncharacterized protein (DUF305 family)